MRPIPFRPLLAIAAASLTCAYAPDLLAEDAVSVSSVIPPQLVSAPPVVAPDTTTPREAVSVELDLTIDASGRVRAATVTHTGGTEFDERALAAVREFVFQPAKSGGEALAVTIGYRYVFPAVAGASRGSSAAVAQAEAVSVNGSALTKAPPEPVSSAAPESSVSPDGAVASFEATAEVAAPARETVKRTIPEAELTKIPGTRGDALRAIEVMPGVARTGIGDGTPILRGSGADESQTYLDGIPVPFLYHFGGVTSFFNSRLLSRVDLYPGNFSSRFGRVTGGVIDARVRDPKADSLHGVLDLSLIDSSLFVETPLGENTSIALSGRRSNIDLVYSSLVPKDAFSVVAAPVYYDYQGLVSHRFGPNHKLRVLAYGSSDSIKLVLSHPNDEDPGLTGTVKGALGFYRLQAELYSKLSPSVSQELVVAAGRLIAEQQLGELGQVFRGQEVHARGEWSFELMPSLRATAGFDLFSMFLEGEYRGTPPTAAEGNPRDADPIAAQRVVRAKSDAINVVRPAVHAELAYRPVKQLLLVPGVRADYAHEFSAWSVDPRLTARYEISDSTALKVGAGRYSQPPLFWMSVPSIGNTKLDPYHAWQVGGGIEQRFGKLAKLGLEGFYKKLDRVVTGTPDGAAPHFVNAGRGRVYGLEFSAEARPDAETFGYIAYTLSRSERGEHNKPLRLFDSDQTHILSLVLSRKLGYGWEVGARFRLVSGNPSTPVVGSIFDARSGLYLPEYGPVNSDRDPLFQQLDLRAEKAFQAGPVRLTPYLDIQNVYNAKNASGYRYNYDYSKREAVSGLSFFPNLGLRGEL